MKINILLVFLHTLSVKENIRLLCIYLSYKKFLLFFFTEYKNEWKEQILTTKKIKKSDFYRMTSTEIKKY